MKISQLLLEDAQSLIDGQVEFRFKGVDGVVSLVDGTMAGVEYWCFEFRSGPFSGKKIYCSMVPAVTLKDLVDAVADGRDVMDTIRESEASAVGEDPKFVYEVDSVSDGMWFNLSPEKKVEDVDDWGGDYVPELDGQEFEVDEEEEAR